MRNTSLVRSTAECARAPRKRLGRNWLAWSEYRAFFSAILRYDPEMVKRLLALTVFVPLLSFVVRATADDGWKQLLSLAGEWEGTEAGRAATVTFSVISGGTAVMESMQMASHEPDMVTVYHRDGDALVATHYCNMGNQPRMRAPGASADTKSIRFRFTDITNLARPGDMHIQHVTFTFIDANHFTQEWSNIANGKEELGLFKWTRKAKK